MKALGGCYETDDLTMYQHYGKPPLFPVTWIMFDHCPYDSGLKNGLAVLDPYT